VTARIDTEATSGLHTGLTGDGIDKNGGRNNVPAA
jgi:hypothetical protein